MTGPRGGAGLRLHPAGPRRVDGRHREPDGPRQVRAVDGRLLRRVRRGARAAAGIRARAVTGWGWTATCRCTTRRSRAELPGHLGAEHRLRPVAAAALRAPVVVPFQAFRTKDAWIIVGCPKEKFWVAAGATRSSAPTWLEDPRFAQFDERSDAPRGLAGHPAPAVSRGRPARTCWPGGLAAAGVPERRGSTTVARRARGSASRRARDDRLLRAPAARRGPRARVADAGRGGAGASSGGGRSAASTPMRCCATCAATAREALAALRGDGAFGLRAHRGDQLPSSRGEHVVERLATVAGAVDIRPSLVGRRLVDRERLSSTNITP